MAAFLPARSEVTEDYWGYARWRAMHRLFSSMLQNFATQARRLARLCPVLHAVRCPVQGSTA